MTDNQSAAVLDRAETRSERKQREKAARQEAKLAKKRAERDEKEAVKAAKRAEKQEKKAASKEDKDVDEYELEFATPFGKIEFEFEPKEKKAQKDQKRKEKQERQAAVQKAIAHRKSAERAEKRASGSGGSRILLTLIVLGAVAAAVGIAYWLFARPGEDEDTVPPEFRSAEGEAERALAEEPQGFAARVRHRVSSAVRAGRQASRETQEETERRFQDMTSGG